MIDPISTARAMRAAMALALASALLLLHGAGGASGAAAQATGWTELDLGGGHRATRYLPRSVRACDPLPMLLFLHGAGGTPEAYAPHLEADAEALGLLLLMPQSSGSMGWSGADTAIINAALDAISAELLVDDTRTYLGGHSAGGALAYILTYDTTGIAAVFSMSAPYYAVSSVTEAGYAAPIHMYYGDTDPNYTGGSASGLEMQWGRLGVPYETDVQAGFGHGTWPPSSIRAGLDFLLAHRHPGAAPPSRCGDADAGAASLDAGAIAVDASAISADASSISGDGGGGVSADVGVARDTGGGRGSISSGCACRAGQGRGPFAMSTLLALMTLALATLARLRPRARRSLRAQRSRAH